MSSDFGKNIKIQLFGQSHSEAIGVVIDGLPPGICLDMDYINRFLQRRAPGQSDLVTSRKEADLPEIISGLSGGMTCGAPLCAIFRNTDTRSLDYKDIKAVPRPGHADYTAFMKTGGSNDIRGGGHFSARLTAPLTFAGAICAQLLEKKGIVIGAHISSVGNIADRRYDPWRVAATDLCATKEKKFPVIDDAAGDEMKALIQAVAKEGDSIGATIECCILGLPAGIGEPIFDGLENRICAAVFGIPAVKGIEFGAGFSAAEKKGSENNDPFFFEGNTVKTTTNHHGGILGGLSSGMPILFRTAFKPTPSISKEQDSVNLFTKENTKLTIQGRHDPCVAIRAVPCIEAAAAIAIYDLLGEK
ncbi:MAG: chorismate synthase [Clostridia bacterium]|nr:chorismate synthase [Clostridia bacterium]